MADMNIVITSGTKEALNDAAASVKRTAAKAKGKTAFFEWSLVITVCATACVGLYESLTEKHLPYLSILSVVHRYGYLKDYPVIYEPNKGIWHPLGWTGSAMMVVMMLYTLRKRVAALRFLGAMRHWLSAHMFLGIMGPLLVTLHTTFKFHGLISTSFWCMIATMIFGILGRYIYIQIPRGISGAELGVKDIDRIVEGLDKALARYIMSDGISRSVGGMDTAEHPGGPIHPLKALYLIVRSDIVNRIKIYRIMKALRTRYNLTWRARRDIISNLQKRSSLLRRKNLLAASHALLHYWHVFHIPLAIVMFIIMFLHIVVYFIFRTGF